MLGKDVRQAAELLKAGKVIAIPTETVYGLAASALDLNAVAEIFAVKQRPSFDPLIIHVQSIEYLLQWVKAVPTPLASLAKRFMPGALTLLLEKQPSIPDLVTSGSAYVAVRVPSHPLTQKLIAQIDFPLAAPSANPFGYISPTTAQHVNEQLGEKIPYILDGGPCNIGLESTIVGMEQGKVTVFRKGGIAIEEIEAIVGAVQVKAHSSSNPKSPGQLKSHYAPKIPLVIGKLEKYLKEYPKERIGFISFDTFSSFLPSKNQIQLSKNKDYKEAAQVLFAAMRSLDAMDLDLIVANLVPEEDLGRAINDRLKRAAAR